MTLSIKKIALIALALMTVWLGACKVSKDIATPQPELPSDFRKTARTNSAAAQGYPASAADSAGIADLPWKNFFADPVLELLIDSAIAKNYDMQLALKNIESARLVLSQSKLGYLPDFSLQVTASSSRPSDNSLNGLSLSSFLHSKHLED